MKKVVERLNRVLAIVLAIAMVATCIPQTALTVYASETEESTESTTESGGDEESPAPPEEKVESPADESGDGDAEAEVPVTPPEEEKVEEPNPPAEVPTEKPADTLPNVPAETPDDADADVEAPVDTDVDASANTLTETDEVETDVTEKDILRATGTLELKAIEQTGNAKYTAAQVEVVPADGKTETANSTKTYFAVTMPAGYKIKGGTLPTVTVIKIKNSETTTPKGTVAEENDFNVKDDTGSPKKKVYSVDVVKEDDTTTEILVTVQMVRADFEVTSNIPKIDGTDNFTATIAYTSGTTNRNSKKVTLTDGNGAQIGNNIVFTVTVATNYELVTKPSTGTPDPATYGVSYQILGADGKTYGAAQELTASGQNNDTYTITAGASINNDIKINVITRKQTVKATFTGYENPSQSNFTVYKVKKGADGSYTKESTAMDKTNGLALDKAGVSYFIVEPASGYKIISVKKGASLGTDVGEQTATGLTGNTESKVYELTAADTAPTTGNEINIAVTVALKLSEARTIKLTTPGIELVDQGAEGSKITYVDGTKTGTLPQNATECKFKIVADTGYGNPTDIEYRVGTGKWGPMPAAVEGVYTLPIEIVENNIEIRATSVRETFKLTFKDFQGDTSDKYAAYIVTKDDTKYTRGASIPKAGVDINSGEETYFLISPKAGNVVGDVKIGDQESDKLTAISNTGLENYGGSYGGKVYKLTSAQTAKAVEVTASVSAAAAPTVTFAKSSNAISSNVDVYTVTKADTEDAKWVAVKNAAAVTCKAGKDINFIIVPKAKYKGSIYDSKNASGIAIACNGSQNEEELSTNVEGKNKYTVYTIPAAKLKQSVTVTIKAEVDKATADKLTLTKASDGYPNYTVSISDANAVEDSESAETNKIYYSAAGQKITVTVTPKAGYELAATGGIVNTKDTNATITPSNGTGNAKTFEVETTAFAASDDAAVENKVASYTIKVVPTALTADNKTITFEKATGAAEGLTYEVPVAIENINVGITKDNTVTDKIVYKLTQATAKEITFTVTTSAGDKLPKVTYKAESDTSATSYDEYTGPTNTKTYTYKIPVSLLADKTVTIDEVDKPAASTNKTLKIGYRGDKVDITVYKDESGTETEVTGGTVEKDKTLAGADDDGYEIVKYSIPHNTKIKVVASVDDSYKGGWEIASYKVGDAEKISGAGEESHEETFTLDNDTNIAVDVAEKYRLLLIDSNGNEIDTENGVYPVTYETGGKKNEYEAYGFFYASKEKKTVGDVELVGTVSDNTKKSTATKDETDAGKVKIVIKEADAGKTLTLKLYAKANKEELFASYTLKVAPMVTKATIANVKSKKITQSVDSISSNLITVTPADAGANLDLSVTWTDDTAKRAGETELAALNPRIVKEGEKYYFVFETGVLDTDAKITELNGKLAKATLYLADKTKGAKTNGKYEDAAIINKKDGGFQIQVAKPTLNKPTAKVAATDDISITLQLGNDGKAAIPVKGQLWYKVTVKANTITNKTKPGQLISGPTDFYVNAEEKNDTKIRVANVGVALGGGAEWPFTVEVRLVQAMKTGVEVNLANVTGAVPAGTLTEFASTPVTINNVKTKNPYYATSLKFKKGKNSSTTVYTGQTKAEVAIVDFGAKTSYASKDYIKVEDVTPGVTNKLILTMDNVVDIDGANCKIYVNTASGTVTDATNSKSYKGVDLGKHILRVTTTNLPEGTQPVSADLVVTVERGVEHIDLNVSTNKIYKEANKAPAALKVTPVYNSGNTKNSYEAKRKAVKDYVLLSAKGNGSTTSDTPYVSPKDKRGKDLVSINPKTGQVTISSEYSPATYSTKNTFYVRATAADFTRGASDTEVYGYSEQVTITDTGIALGDIVIVKPQQAQGAASGSAVTYDNVAKASKTVDSSKLNGAFIRILKSTVNEANTHTDADFLDLAANHLTLTVAKNSAFSANASGTITVGNKAAANVKITVAANDGSKVNKEIKLTVNSLQPEELGLKVEWGTTELNVKKLGKDNYGDVNVPINFRGTTDTKLKLSVMRRTGEAWAALDDLSDLGVSISGATTVTKPNALGQGGIIIAKGEKATVKLTYTPTNNQNRKITKTFNIVNTGYKEAQTNTLSVKLYDDATGRKENPKLVSGSYGQPQTVQVKLEIKGDYDETKNYVVKVTPDKADSANPKNSALYLSLAGHKNFGDNENMEWSVTNLTSVGTDKNKKTTGTFDLTFALTSDATKTNLQKGTYKLQFTCGSIGTNGEFIPATKTVVKTITAAPAVALKKASYKPASKVKMFVRDNATGGCVLKGTGAGWNTEYYGNAAVNPGTNAGGTTLMNANIDGQPNYFKEFFELDSDDANTLKLKASDWSKAALTAIGVDKETPTVVDVFEKLSSNNKAAKNQLIGYVNYNVTEKEGYAPIAGGTTQITVSFDVKNGRGKYAITSPTVLKPSTGSTMEASAIVTLGGSTADVDIADAYVAKVDGKDSNTIQVESVDGTDGNKYGITFNGIPVPTTAAKTYNLVMYIVPSDSMYKDVIAAKKPSATPIALTNSASAAPRQDADYVAELEKYAIKLTPKITVANPATTGNKISVATADKAQVFGVANYNAKTGKYEISVPYTMNIPCTLGAITGKIGSATTAGFIDFVDVPAQKKIKISVDKTELGTQAANKSYGKKLSVKATVAFTGSRAEDITFSLTMPQRMATGTYSSYADMTSKLDTLAKQEAFSKEVEKKVMADWGWWIADSVSTSISGNLELEKNDSNASDKELWERLSPLFDATEKELKKLAPKDSGITVKMTQYDETAGINKIKIASGDFTMPTSAAARSLTIRADLVDASIAAGTTKVGVDIVLTIPKLMEKPKDYKTTIDGWNTANPFTWAEAKDAATLAASAAGVGKLNLPANSTLKVYVTKHEITTQPTTDAGGTLTASIELRGTRYGGTVVKKEDFTVTTPKLNNLTQAKTAVEAKLDKTNTGTVITGVTNATEEEYILAVAREAVNNPAYKIAWSTVTGEGYVKTLANSSSDGSIKGKLVITDPSAQTDGSQKANVDLVIAKLTQDLTQVETAVKTAVGVGTNNVGTDATRTLIITTGNNKEATVKEAILNAAKTAAAGGYCDITYKAFSFKAATEKAKGSLAFTLEIKDLAAPTNKKEVKLNTYAFEWQTFADAKTALNGVPASLKATNATTKEDVDDAVKAALKNSAIKATVTMESSTGYTNGVKAATMLAAGEVKYKVKLEKTGETPYEETFTAAIAQLTGLANAQAAAQAALDKYAALSVSDIENSAIKDTTKTAVEAAVQNAVDAAKTTYTVTVSTDTTKTKYNAPQIDVAGSVKITLTVAVTGKSVEVSRTWTNVDVALTQNESAAKTVIEGLVGGLTVANNSTDTTVKADLQTAIDTAHTNHTLANEYTLDATTPVTLADKVAATWNLDGSVNITVKWKKGNTVQTDIVVNAKKINKLAADTEAAKKAIEDLIVTSDFKNKLSDSTTDQNFIDLILKPTSSDTRTSAYSLAWQTADADKFVKDTTAHTIKGKLEVTASTGGAGAKQVVDIGTITYPAGAAASK